MKYYIYKHTLSFVSYADIQHLLLYIGLFLLFFFFFPDVLSLQFPCLPKEPIPLNIISYSTDIGLFTVLPPSIFPSIAQKLGLNLFSFSDVSVGFCSVTMLLFARNLTGALFLALLAVYILLSSWPMCTFLQIAVVCSCINYKWDEQQALKHYAILFLEYCHCATEMSQPKTDRCCEFIFLVWRKKIIYCNSWFYICKRAWQLRKGFIPVPRKVY